MMILLLFAKTKSPSDHNITVLVNKLWQYAVALKKQINTKIVNVAFRWKISNRYGQIDDLVCAIFFM